MKNNETRFIVLFAAVAVLVFAVTVVLKGRLALAPGGTGNSGGAVAQVPDSVAVSPILGGDDEVVANANAGYYFSMPANWYVEKNVGAGLAVYPDYDPKSGVAPECKIEISDFANVGTGSLNSWITNYLHADPTADVAEISRTPVQIGDASGGGAGANTSTSSSAIQWYGVLNGVTTTLVYALEPDTAQGQKNILEIAPSTLSESGDADNSDCDLVLQALVANLKFGAYEP